MHIPDGIITIDQALIYWILTILIMAICFYKFQKDSQKDKKIVSMAIFSVFTVIITSLSIPSPLGVPIHFFLIPLIAIILGPHSSGIVAFISLIIQALALNMGGLTSLGANFIVIGFIISITTYFFYTLFKDLNEKFAIFGGTVIGIIFATLGQIIILLISGTMSLNALLATLIPFYLFISIIEGAANVVIISAIKTMKPEIMEINE